MLEAVGVITALGAIFGTGLSLANKKFAVNTDPRIEKILALLPGANCGSCGYPGCSGLAEAIVARKASVAPCIACTSDNRKKIAAIMGITGEIEENIELRKVPILSCNGNHITAPKLFEYKGIKDCHLVANFFAGPGRCNFGCLGFGSCVKICPFGAISMGENGLPQFDYSKCTGCGLCVQQCPQKVITLVNANSKIHVKCNNRDKGKAAILDCSVSCISCGICEKNCPTGAIKLREDSNGSIPVIDYSICNECGLCVKNCPRHCIQIISLVKNKE